MSDNQPEMYTVHSYKKLTRVRPSISPKLLESLQKTGVHTCKDFLLQSPLHLMKQIDIDYTRYLYLTRTISNSITPRPTTILSLLNSNGALLNTSLKQLDSALQGGLPSGMITEITGPAGCGKTQFCLMMSVVGALPVETRGCNTNVLYLDTEGTFSATRMLEIATNRFPDHFTEAKSLNSLSECVLVSSINNYESLIKSLNSMEERLIRDRVGLIVLDSVASVIRAEFHGGGEEESGKLSAALTQLAATLKFIADTFKIPIIVTNQITHSLAPSHSLPGSTLTDGQDVLQATAALGITWSHSVNIRLILQYWREDVKTLTISKSPYTPNMTLPYTIRREGITIETELQGWCSVTLYFIVREYVHPVPLSLGVEST